MKKIFTIKTLVAAIAAGFAVMFIMINIPAGTEPLSPDGDYTYPAYCIGHESEFVVDKGADSYINHKNVADAITYVGKNGYMSRGDIELTASKYDADTNSFYNESINFGFKLPEGWEALSGTPKADENPAYLYDYSAISPDGDFLLTVKYHDLEADGIKIKDEKDYIMSYGQIKTEKYWNDGYQNISQSNIFAGDMFLSLADMCSAEFDHKAMDMGRIFLASQRLNERYVLLIEYRTPYFEGGFESWDGFYSK
ncbi:MAG: hypothetical protein IKU47_04690 [Oscillospiraceae bacterium]|nr:hypothetical protein [Oscillospiraceae bacterium]